MEAHDLAQAKAAKLLKKRTPSVASGLSAGTEHQTRRQRSYAASLGTVSFVDPPHEDEYGQTVEKYENTYQMEPNTRFPVSEINCILQDVLKPLKDKQYDPEECKTMTKSLSDCVKSRVKELSIPRYKIICLVHIGQINNQGLRISSRCLWNAKFDTYASFEFKNHSLFAVASVYGVYFE